MTTRYFVTPDGTFVGGFSDADPPEGALEVPSAPDDARQVWQDGAWKPVQSTKAELRALVSSLRDAARSKVSWGGHLVDANDTALGKITGRALAFSSGYRTEPTEWIMADNSVVQLSSSDFLDMAAAVDQAVDTAYARAANIKAQVTAGLLTTREAVIAAWETP